MKLLKKAGALMLVLTLLAAQPVFADTAESYTDNLNKYTEDVTMPWSGYANATYASDVFIQHSGQSGYIDADAGPDGSAALKMTQKQDSNHVNLKTRLVSMESAENAGWLFTYDFKILQNPDNANKTISIGGNNSGNNSMFGITLESGVWKFVDKQSVNPSYAYTLDHWYTAVLTLTGDTRSGAIIDSETGEVVISSSKAFAANDTRSFSAVYMQAYAAADGVTNTAVMVFDNAVLTAYDCAANAPSVQSASVTSGATGVQRNKELAFEFDQVVSGTAVLTKSDGTEVTGAVAAQPTANKLVISYAGLLERNTKYKVSFSGVTNGSLSCNSEELTFTTEDMHLYNDVEIVSTNNASDKTQVTFKISDSYNYPIFSGSVLAAVYTDGKMTGLDMVTLTNEACTSAITKEFDLGTMESGAQLQLVLLDTTSGPVPLASGAFAN